MKLGIMQPYFMPYIGYFQLIAAVDIFVLYDNIKYTKKGWINRNRMLLSGKEMLFSLPLKKDSDKLDVVQRELSVDFDRAKLLNQFRGSYYLAPHFSETYELLEKIIGFEENNLFSFIHNSIVQICLHLDIETKICISSSLNIEHKLKSQDKVLAICDVLGADTYINAIGGKELYNKDAFYARGIKLQFIRAKPFEYVQFGRGFIPWLSIADVLMFNSVSAVRASIYSNYELI
jgi:hypothetical protein